MRKSGLEILESDWRRSEAGEQSPFSTHVYHMLQTSLLASLASLQSLNVSGSGPRP